MRWHKVSNMRWLLDEKWQMKRHLTTTRLEPASTQNTLYQRVVVTKAAQPFSTNCLDSAKCACENCAPTCSWFAGCDRVQALSGLDRFWIIIRRRGQFCVVFARMQCAFGECVRVQICICNVFIDCGKLASRQATGWRWRRNNQDWWCYTYHFSVIHILNNLASFTASVAASHFNWLAYALVSPTIGPHIKYILCSSYIS